MSTTDKRWVNLDGMLHVEGGAVCDCDGECRQCGARTHYQPVYGGYIYQCEKCEADRDRWSTGPMPPHDSAGIIRSEKELRLAEALSMPLDRSERLAMVGSGYIRERLDARQMAADLGLPREEGDRLLAEHRRVGTYHPPSVDTVREFQGPFIPGKFEGTLQLQRLPEDRRTISMGARAPAYTCAVCGRPNGCEHFKAAVEPLTMTEFDLASQRQIAAALAVPLCMLDERYRFAGCICTQCTADHDPGDEDRLE